MQQHDSELPLFLRKAAHKASSRRSANTIGWKANFVPIPFWAIASFEGLPNSGQRSSTQASSLSDQIAAVRLSLRK